MEVDFLILADGAQVAGNKLYLLGGAWNALTVRQFPARHVLSIAIGINIEWVETNKLHSFKVELRDEAADRTLGEIEGQFETGRPTDCPPGGEQLFVLAVNVPLLFDQAGHYLARLLLNGKEAKRRLFVVNGLSPSE